MSTQLKPLLQSILSNVDKDITQMPLISSISAKSGLKPSLIFFLLGFGVMLLAVFDILPDLLTTLFGMLYPAYMSYKAIEREEEEQKKIWLTYWIVFGLLTTMDDTLGFVLAYIPGFYALRFVVYIWMFYPRANNGATVIYVALKPVLQRVKEQIDAILNPGLKRA